MALEALPKLKKKKKDQIKYISQEMLVNIATKIQTRFLRSERDKIHLNFLIDQL